MRATLQGVRGAQGPVYIRGSIREGKVQARSRWIYARARWLRSEQRWTIERLHTTARLFRAGSWDCCAIVQREAPKGRGGGVRAWEVMREGRVRFRSARQAVALQWALAKAASEVWQ